MKAQRNAARHTRVHTLGVLSVSIALVFGVAPLDVRAQDAVEQISIPAQALGQALLQLGKQTSLQIFYPQDLVNGLSAPAVSGNVTPEQALQQLLRGTGIEYSLQGNSVTLSRHASGDTAQLAPVTVTGSSETATGPLRGYAATRSVTATKTDTPIIETPQSITIVGAEEIETTKAQTLVEALGYVAGVGSKVGPIKVADEMVVRGFEASAYTGSLYRDGTKYTVNIYNGQQEPYGLERIELLKGASSVLYGASGPGGIINTVTKRPTTESLGELNVEYGSFDRKQVSGDFGGSLTEDGEFSYRATFLQRDSKTFIDHIDDNRTFLAGGLAWRPSERTSLTLLADYQKDKTAENLGLPAQATVYSSKYGRIPRNRYTGTPGYDKYESERYTVGYLFEHAFTDQITLRQNVRYYDFHGDIPQTLTYNLSADGRTSAVRYAYDRTDDSQAIVADTSLQFKLGEGMIKHTAIVGVDYSRMKHVTTRDRRSAQPFDYFTPDYSIPVGEILRTDGTDTNRTHRLGFYVQDQMKIDDRLVLLLGGRYDTVDLKSESTISTTKTDETDSAFTGRAGLVYLFDNGVAPFFSYSESFEPLNGADRTGDRFKPVTGEQYEVGIRYQPDDYNFTLSAAVYQLKRQNLAVTDPVDSSYDVQLGEVRSRGIELEARGELSRNINVIVAYAYTDARTTKASPLYPEEEGERMGQVPYHQFSLWGDYRFGDLGLPGLKAGLGMRYFGSTKFLYGDGMVPAFTIFDAMISYEKGPWRFALNANNIADKKYVAVCQSACFYGEGRRIIGSVSYRW
ncbi:TonB-dependent siderophore receptor [Paenalcaligenes sp. Me131]|uniref:TonB-dependent siderophore receptor n=1 Tax=Paenalcaligenes sp. Me131 TaxID=3392636 RepID=UPI003D27C527